MLAPGVLIGKYEVLEPIGEGGMGEVWKARDTTLEREVALKTLPEALASDPRRLARLEREAKLLAALNHPNIAGIHGLEKSDGTCLLELELVKGETLDELISAGTVETETALRIAVQIAEALEAAHTGGIVHRDLKPSNVMLTPEGAVKVLDLGLAKMVSADSTPASHALDPTASVTREGVIQGTPAYMSPEQIRSGRVDAQTDIWAFGCILFEMLAGESPFAQKSSTETLGKVLERAPDFERLRPDTPAPVVRLLRRCLEKDPRDRLHHIGDAGIELRDALTSPTPQSAEGALSSSRPLRRRWALTVGGAALVATAAWTAGFLVPRSAPESRPEPALYPVGPPVRAPRLVVGGDRVVSISADGTRLAYVSNEEIWLQTLGRQDASPIARSGPLGHPFFSSDGEWMAFLSPNDSLLRKVSIHDRVPITVAALGNERFLGGTWQDQTIVFTTQTGVYRVSADQNGGEAELVIEPPEDRTYAWPEFLPDGQSVLLTVLAGTSINDADIALLDLETKRLSDALVRGAVSARYVPGSEGNAGYLVYATEGSRLATRRFDPNTREVDPVRAEVPGVQARVGGTYLSAAFDASDTGKLVHVPPRTRPQNRLVWVDIDGNEEILDAALPGFVGYPRVSPDGTRVAFDVAPGTSNRRIWTMDLARGIPVQLSSVGGDIAAPYEDLQALWSRDGQRIYFGSLRTGSFQIWRRAADGSGRDERLVDDPDVFLPLASTPDDRLLVMRGPYREADIGILDPDEPTTVEWLMETPFSEVTPSLSPDGRWIAYASNELGDRYEIYVQSFPSGERKTRISRNGGRYPLWGLEGSGELYYLGLDESGDAALMAATVDTSPELKVAGVRALVRNDFVRRALPVTGLRPYDISPVDGRFLMLLFGAEAESNQMTIWLTLNWVESLTRVE